MMVKERTSPHACEHIYKKAYIFESYHETFFTTNAADPTDSNTIASPPEVT